MDEEVTIPQWIKRFAVAFLVAMLVCGVVAGLSRDPAPYLTCASPGLTLDQLEACRVKTPWAP